MISFFPTIYDDELAYSIFARYHLHSGHLSYVSTSADLFQKNEVIPSAEFIVPLKAEAIQMLCRTMTFGCFLEKHTMIPYYIRFLPKERRNRAFALLMNMDRSFYDSLYMRRSKLERRKHFRYCPLCAAEDREKYGETFWHRKHQLMDIDICLEHKCRLNESDVGVDSDSQRFTLTAAETVVPYDEQCNRDISDMEVKIAGYVLSVFEAPVDLENDVPIGAFLHMKLRGTPYTSARGENVYARKLYSALTDYYSGLEQYSFKAWWYVQKLFCGQNFHTFDVCLVAAFLGVPVSELLNIQISDKPLFRVFDTQIMDMRNQGLTYKQIAEEMKVSLDTVKAVGEGRYASVRKSRIGQADFIP